MIESLREAIAGCVREHPANRFPGSAVRYFDEPLVGVAAAADPLFESYKTVIGAFHRTPREVLASAVTVVCWVLPITGPTRESNGRERELPSLTWAQTRSFGEQFNDALRRRVCAWLEERGHAAVAPVLTPGFQRFSETPVGFASTWSERHAAYAAGLGTFGLSDGFITSRGIAHRLGSVVTDARLEPTSAGRPGIHDHCPFYDGAACTICIERCPAGAISAEGHDKARCNAYLRGTIDPALVAPWGTPVPGCGLCQTRVPCEDRVPRRSDR